MCFVECSKYMIIPFFSCVINFSWCQFWASLLLIGWMLSIDLVRRMVLASLYKCLAVISWILFILSRTNDWSDNVNIYINMHYTNVLPRTGGMVIWKEQECGMCLYILSFKDVHVMSKHRMYNVRHIFIFMWTPYRVLSINIKRWYIYMFWTYSSISLT